MVTLPKLLAGLTAVLWLSQAGCANECETGDRDCDCYPNLTCNADKDGNWLVCSSGKCRRPACEMGESDCSCFPNRTCNTGLTCQVESGSLRCVSEACPGGSTGCACLTGGLCQAGLVCEGAVCVGDSNQVLPPANPKCYTPCRDDLELGNGDIISCSVEGLMEGCLGDAICIQGTCVSPSQKDGLPSCVMETDCPDYQTCIQNACYSNCEYDSDCDEDHSCHRHVCRRTCSMDSDTCPQGTHCESTDGQGGVCMALSQPEGSLPNVDGSFSISTDLLTFSNVQTQRALTLVNNSSTALEFTIRKVRHTYTDEVGYHSVTANALSWLSLGEWGQAVQQPEVTILVDGDGGEKQIVVVDAFNPSLKRWKGIIEVTSPQLGTQRIHLSYSEVPDGKWQGKMYYFAQFGDVGLDAWIQGKDAGLGASDYQNLLGQVGNAFLQKWGVFRKGWISYQELMAALNATTSGSWAWPSVRSTCPWPNGACFLFDNPNGYVEYTDDHDVVPVPTGVAELPFAVNLRVDPDSGDARVFSGRIDTQDSLHYLGDPAITVAYQLDPADPNACSAVANGACVVYLQSLQADAYVGGRFRRADASESCPAGGDFAAVKRPWLVPGFDAMTGEENGQRYTYECRINSAPFTVAPDGSTDISALNQNLAGANPVPNGQLLHRGLELVDGALVDSETLIIIFRERFNSFLDPDDSEGFTAYGVMVLRRAATTLEEDDYLGQVVTALPQTDDNLAQVGCSQGLINEILDGDPLNASNADAMAEGVIHGTRQSADAPEELASGDVEKVHYFCEDTGLIDGGPDDDGSASAVKVTCPWGSRVQFFTLDSTLTDCQQPALAGLNCQQDGTCQDTLNDWDANAHCSIRLDPVWNCTGNNAVYCDDDRLDLRAEKVFFKETAGEPVFVPIWPAIANAFRYKIRFQSRTGASIGFAPQMCIPNSDAVPYCYDPAQIEEIRERVDCAVHLFHDYYDHPDGGLSADNRQLLRDYLAVSFSRDDDEDKDGFDRLYAELLVMMGDESYTKAFASRFDLAGSYNHAFEGSLLEPGGLDLSGGAGFEMYQLYQASQYYQLVLDRFYVLSPYIWESVNHGATDAARNYISQETVVYYIDRVARASTQRIRAQAEIAKHYQNFNRPDLARRVVERAYSSAYLESVVLARMMLKVVEVSSPATRAQIRDKLQKTQRSYDAALTEMRDVYGAISEEVNYFGYSPDYIPFPALDPGDTNAFEKSYSVAQQRLSTAVTKEDIALTATRAFDTDAASFQAELVQVRQTYENQLGDLCGTFTGTDSQIYPATPKYAYLHPDAAYLGNPCGLVGNGTIHDEQGNLKQAQLSLKLAISNFDSLLEELDIERQRIESYCDEVLSFAKMMYGRGETRESLHDTKFMWEGAQAAANVAMEFVTQKINALDCLTIVGVGAAGTNCPQRAIGVGWWWAARMISFGAVKAAKVMVYKTEQDLRRHEDYNVKLETEQECEYAKINGEAKLATLALDIEAMTLEMAKSHYGVLQVMSKVEGGYNKAQRLIAQQGETEEMSINVEAARNNPNVRIYKNDAVLAAERTFNGALAAAYKATQVYEYYTSQTYGKKGELFLIRMAAHGDYTLENYLYELEESFYAFEEDYGNPDLRVLVLSLRDDILDIPRLDDSYRPLSEAQRVELFRERLTDPAMMDGNGYFTAPFNTTLRQVSPVTRNHKILFLEAEFVGSDVGNREGRIYLRQRGTGVVRGVSGDTSYYAFPERLAVINTFFNGERMWIYSDNNVLRTYHLQDRPLLNTRWELIINRVDELVNEDINLLSLTDVRLYFFYTDFTAL